MLAMPGPACREPALLAEPASGVPARLSLHEQAGSLLADTGWKPVFLTSSKIWRRSEGCWPMPGPAYRKPAILAEPASGLPSRLSRHGKDGRLLWGTEW